MKFIFSHDVYPSTPLLDDDGLMTKPVKSTFCKELEKSLSPEDYKPCSEWQECKPAYMIDVMA